MIIFSDHLLCTLSGIIITLITIIIIYFKWKFNYWNKQGLYSPKPTILFGNIKDMLTLKLTIGELVKKFYVDFKSKGLKHGGLYFTTFPFYLPTDLNIIKNILQKDFEYFMNRGLYHNEDIDPLSANLLNLEDTKWRNLRFKLTPTFTSAKMKMMFETILNSTKGLTDLIDEESINNSAIEIKEVCSRFTTDIIGSCVFGFDCNCLKDPDTAFRFYGKRVFENNMLEGLLLNLQLILPNSIFQFFNLRSTKLDVERFFMKLVNDTVQYRKENNVSRNDFVHLLLQLKNKVQLQDKGEIIHENDSKMTKLTMNEIAAQCFIFFIAGFETTSTTMTFALFELSIHLDIQKKVREEINNVLIKYDGKVTYDACMEMYYLEKVIDETLRKYPPAPVMLRKCNKNYTVPHTSVCLEKGVTVAIPVLAIHHDPEYYPEPEKFDPERFSEVNKNQRPAFSFIPFGEGPRICIGSKFAMIQIKVGLITLLTNYDMTLNQQTPLPLEFDKKTFLTANKNGIFLNIKKIV